MVRFLDLRAACLELQSVLDEAYRRVTNSGWYIIGEEVERFEAERAEYFGAQYCVSVGYGLDALRLLFRAAGVRGGDETIVPANTLIATWLAVSSAGAKPVPVEPDPRTFNLYVRRLVEVVSTRTRAIIVGRLHGKPCDMNGVRAIVRTHGLLVLEDAAQGALGDGGAVATNDERWAIRACLVRRGSRSKCDQKTAGINSRLHPQLAAFLRVKLQRSISAMNSEGMAANIYERIVRICPRSHCLPSWNGQSRCGISSLYESRTETTLGGISPQQESNH